MIEWLPLLTTGLASLTALFIALFVYPHQKRRDRETEVMRERRAAYIRYASSFKRLYVAQPFKNVKEPRQDFLSIGEVEVEFYNARDELYILAPDSIVDLVLKHDTRVRSWISGHNVSGTETFSLAPDIRERLDAMMTSFGELLGAFRNDTFGQTKTKIEWSIRRPKGDVVKR